MSRKTSTNWAVPNSSLRRVLEGSVAGSRVVPSRAPATTNRGVQTNGQFSTSWRQPSPSVNRNTPPAQSGYQSRYATTAQTLIGKGTLGTGPGDYKPGEIIRTLHVHPLMDGTLETTDKSVGLVPNVGYVSGKLRPFIVLAVSDTRMQCVPMLTSGGKGIEKLPARKKLECIYLRSWTDEDEIWKTCKPRDYLMCAPDYITVSGSYTNWTATYDVSYDWPIAKVGAITDESLNRLTAMHRIGYRAARVTPRAEQVPKLLYKLNAIPVRDEFNEMKRKELASLEGSPSGKSKTNAASFDTFMADGERDARRR